MAVYINNSCNCFVWMCVIFSKRLTMIKNKVKINKFEYEEEVKEFTEGEEDDE